MYQRFAGCLLAALCFALVSCKESGTPSADPTLGDNSSSGDAAGSNPAQAKPISKEDKASAIEFGKRIEAAVRSGDEAFLSKLFDFEGMITESLGDHSLDDEFMRGFRKGMGDPGSQAAQNLLQAKVDFVSYREVRGHPGVLMRLRINDGLEYLEYELKRRPGSNSDWVVADAFTHSIGTFISDLLKSTMTPMLAELDQSILEKFLKRNSTGPNLEHMPQVLAMFGMARDPSQAEAALAIWNGFPASVQEERLARMAHISNLGNLLEEIDGPHGKSYFKAIDDFERAFPGDPAFALMSIDANIGRGDFAGARQAIANLASAMGDDEFLSFYEGWIDLFEEKYDDAERRARTYLAAVPADDEGANLLLEAGFGAGNHAVTAEALTLLEGQHEMDFSGVLEIPEWAEFVQSEAGKAWAAER